MSKPYHIWYQMKGNIIMYQFNILNKEKYYYITDLIRFKVQISHFKTQFSS